MKRPCVGVCLRVEVCAQRECTRCTIIDNVTDTMPRGLTSCRLGSHQPLVISMLLGRLLRVAALTGTSPWLGSRPVGQRATPPSLQFSSTFSTAAEAQLEVLSELIRPLDRAAVFARREAD